MKKIVDMDEFGRLFDKLTKRVDGTEDFISGTGWTATIIKHWLYAQPDAEEKRGKWELHKDGSGTCTKCNTTQKNVWDMDGFQNFCGHCGANMDLGEEE